MNTHRNYCSALEIITITVFALLLYSRNSDAVPFQYDEAISGDLPASPSAIFPFDVGTNIVKGTISVNETATAFLEDRDSFAFSLPKTTYITQVTFSFTTTITTVSGIINFVGAGYQIEGAGTPQPFIINLLGNSPVSVPGTISAICCVQPFIVDNYQLFLSGPIDMPNPIGSFVTSYEWDIKVAPEPTSLYLLISGLLLIVGKHYLGRALHG